MPPASLSDQPGLFAGDRGCAGRSTAISSAGHRSRMVRPMVHPYIYRAVVQEQARSGAQGNCAGRASRPFRPRPVSPEQRSCTRSGPPGRCLRRQSHPIPESLYSVAALHGRNRLRDRVEAPTAAPAGRTDKANHRFHRVVPIAPQNVARRHRGYRNVAARRNRQLAPPDGWIREPSDAVPGWDVRGMMTRRTMLVLKLIAKGTTG